MLLSAAPDVPENCMLVTVALLEFMNPTVSVPIHAATAMLTATVIAIRIIDAITGLRAFLHRLNIRIFTSSVFQLERAVIDPISYIYYDLILCFL
jgi:hypothetical protein